VASMTPQVHSVSVSREAQTTWWCRSTQPPRLHRRRPNFREPQRNTKVSWYAYTYGARVQWTKSTLSYWYCWMAS